MRGDGSLKALELLLNQVEAALGGSGSEAGDPEALQQVFTIFVLCKVSERLVRARELPIPRHARLFALAEEHAELENEAGVAEAIPAAVSGLLGGDLGSPDAVPELLGGVFEGLLGLEIGGARGKRRLFSGRGRRRTGSFFTPSSLTQVVVERALQELSALRRPLDGALSICDPACGSGAFLIALARALVARRREAFLREGSSYDELTLRRQVVESCAGVDLNPLAIAVCELSLWIYIGDPGLSPADGARLFRGDAITGRGFSDRARFPDPVAFDWLGAFPDCSQRGFDLVIGNPPWIAYAGRATQPLEPARRRFLAENYAAFRGYPTLHAVFLERAAELCSRGVVALVVPSPLADLDGYRPARRVFARSHQVCEPMLEFGQDAFLEVMQPCFALIARARSEGATAAIQLGAPFRLTERARSDATARAVEVPRVLQRLRQAECLPREVFREMGFQTTRTVTETLLKRSDVPDAVHSYPLLEGREIGEFRVGPPRLFLKPDDALLARARCRLRRREEYQKVRFVVRQTAKVPIAALHSGMPFRNTLLAGFETEELPAWLIVGLLNSSLYRALHLSMQRDARQAVFPQVKVAHLRALPRPPTGRDAETSRLGELVERATRAGVTLELRRELDRLVFELFGFTPAERTETLAFLAERAPQLVTGA